MVTYIDTKFGYSCSRLQLILLYIRPFVKRMRLIPYQPRWVLMELCTVCFTFSPVFGAIKQSQFFLNANMNFEV